MVFRLVAFTLLSFLLIDLLKMPKVRAMLLMVLISSVAFSAYHYLGSEKTWTCGVLRSAPWREYILD